MESPLRRLDPELRLQRAKRVAAHALKLGFVSSTDVTAASIRDARSVAELLHQFPLIYKADLLSRSQLFRISGVGPNDMVLRTSGSSGAVLEVPWRTTDLISSRRSSARIVAQMRSEAGLQPRPQKPMLAMGASPLHVSAALYEKLALSDSRSSYRVAVDRDIAAVTAGIIEAAPDHLTTYPSIAAHLICQASEYFPSSVLLGGERAPNALKAAIEARGAVLLDSYGCTETGIVAMGVGATGVLETLQDDVVVERIGISTARRQYEKIALTSLHNSSFPILRFVVDDEVQVTHAEGNFVTGIRAVSAGVDPVLIKIAGMNVSTRSLRGIIDSTLSHGAYRITVSAENLNIVLADENRGLAEEVKARIESFLETIGASGQRVNVAAMDAMLGSKVARRIVVEGTQ